MQLSQKVINDFKMIHLKVYKKELSDSQANEMGSQLLSLFKLIYKPIPGENRYETTKKNN